MKVSLFSSILLFFLLSLPLSRGLGAWQTISDVQFFSNDRPALIVTQQPDELHDQYFCQIFSVDLQSKIAKPLFSSLKECQHPRWSPNGEAIAFIALKEGIYHLYLSSAKGEKVRPLFQASRDVQTFSWSPDGQTIAFVMRHPFLPIDSLWTISVKENSFPRAITSNYCVRALSDFHSPREEFSWAPDGKKIVFAYSPSASLDDLYVKSSLAIVEVESLKISLLPKKALHQSSPFYSPDGKWIAFLLSTPPSYAFNRRIAFISTDTSQFRVLPATFNEGADLFSPMLLGWTKDSSHLIVFEPYKTHGHFVFMPIAKEGLPRSFFLRQGAMQSPSLSNNKEWIGFTFQSSNRPVEAYFTSLSKLKAKQFTALHRHLLPRKKSKTTLVNWKSLDGVKIQGILTYPQCYQKGSTYPLVLMIHGGPMTLFDQSFIGTSSFYCVQKLSQKGCFTLRPNPRGSSGYGKVFRTLNVNDWGGKECLDLLTGIDALIKKKLVDPTKLAVMGWSYGAYLAACLICQTDRFKAAVLGAGFYHIKSFASSTDLKRFVPSYLDGWQKNELLYQQRSPLCQSVKINTPCLLLHGTDDLRVSPMQSKKLQQELKRQKKRVKLILIDEMGHGPHKPSIYRQIQQETWSWLEAALLE